MGWCRDCWHIHRFDALSLLYWGVIIAISQGRGGAPRYPRQVWVQTAACRFHFWKMCPLFYQFENFPRRQLCRSEHADESHAGICLHACSLRNLKEDSAVTRRMFEDKLTAAAPAKPVYKQELSGRGSDPWVIKNTHVMRYTQLTCMLKHILDQVQPTHPALGFRICLARQASAASVGRPASCLRC